MKIFRNKLIWIILIIILGLAGYQYWQLKQPNALVTGQVYTLTSSLTGQVKVLVQDNQLVRAGDLLIQFDDATYLVALAEARANYEAVKMGTSPDIANPLAASQSQKVAEEAIRQKMQAARLLESAARQDLEHWTLEHTKAVLAVRGLEASRNPVSPKALNQAKLTELNAKSTLEAAQDTFNTYSRSRATADTELTSYRQELAKLAKLSPESKGQYLALYGAKLVQAEENLQASRIVAPVDGQVVKLGVSNGSLAQAGQFLLSLVPVTAKNLWITTYVPADKAAKLALGQTCQVTFPDINSLQLSGVVEAIKNVSAERLASEVAAAGLTKPANQNSQNIATNGQTNAQASGQTNAQATTIANIASQNELAGEGIAVQVAIPGYDPLTMPALRLGLPARVIF